MGFSTSPLSNSRRGSSLGIKRSSLAIDLLWDLRQIISLSRNVWIWWWLRPHLIISYCWIHQATQDEMLWWFSYIFSKSLFQFQGLMPSTHRLSEVLGQIWEPCSLGRMNATQANNSNSLGPNYLPVQQLDIHCSCCFSKTWEDCSWLRVSNSQINSHL